MAGHESEGRRGASFESSARLAALCACALVAGLVAAKATRDALFLNTFAASLLPRIMTASAVASLGAVLLMARAMARFSPRRVLVFGLFLAFGLVLLEWGLTFVMPRVAAVVVHLHVATFGATLLSAFWSMINERYDPYTAKRVMGRIGSGAAIGGIVGGALAYLAARFLPVSSMLLCVALLDLLALGLLLRLPRTKRPPLPPRAEGEEAAASVTFLAALRILREGSYLRHLAWVVFLGAFMESLLDYAFSAQAAASLPKGPRLAAFFAAYQTGVSLVGFVAQTLLTRRALEGLGLASSGRMVCRTS
jgi:MFS family permease